MSEGNEQSGSAFYSPDNPEGEQIRLILKDEGIDLTRWESYEFHSDILTPADVFHFVVGDSDLPLQVRKALRIGAPVQLRINGNPVMDGRIDTVTASADRHSGQRWSISGRDRLAYAVDFSQDPTIAFKEGATLAEALKQIFTPFGWSLDEQYEVDNEANRAKITARSVRGGRTFGGGGKDLTRGGRDGRTLSKGGKKKGPKVLKSYVLHHTKPFNHEGTFAFASRIAQREGLWIWPSADGETLIVSKPDFEQAPSYRLARREDGGNILSGTVQFSGQDQPTVIIADGFGGGGDWGKSKLRAYCIHPQFGYTKTGEVRPDVAEILARFPDAVEVLMDKPLSFSFKGETPARPLWLHDVESQSEDQLKNYVKREMSLLLRKSLSVRYTVEGHGQMTPAGFRPWAVDTTVDVVDDVADLAETLYVMGVSFTKDKTAGTHTQLTLVRLNTIQF